jgi:hypothetical protein
MLRPLTTWQWNENVRKIFHQCSSCCNSNTVTVAVVAEAVEADKGEQVASVEVAEVVPEEVNDGQQVVAVRVLCCWPNVARVWRECHHRPPHTREVPPHPGSDC